MKQEECISAFTLETFCSKKSLKSFHDVGILLKWLPSMSACVSVDMLVHSLWIKVSSECHCDSFFSDVGFSIYCGLLIVYCSIYLHVARNFKLRISCAISLPYMNMWTMYRSWLRGRTCTWIYCLHS